MTNGPANLADYLRQITYGGNDGIITTFAIVAGFAGAEAQGVVGLGVLAVLVFGMANLTADAVSMGLGEFLSSRSERDLYLSRHDSVAERIAGDPGAAARSMEQHLIQQGMRAEDAGHVADHLATSPDLMADLVLRYDHGMEAPDAQNLPLRALMTFLAFVAFGVIPLMPFILWPTSPASFTWSVLATGFALVLLGLLRWNATRLSLARCLGETLILGSISAAVAYGAGMIVAIFG